MPYAKIMSSQPESEAASLLCVCIWNYSLFQVLWVGWARASVCRGRGAVVDLGSNGIGGRSVGGGLLQTANNLLPALWGLINSPMDKSFSGSNHKRVSKI